MKKILFIGTMMAVLVSCQDMLNIYPHSAVAPGNVSEKDLPALEIGMYNRVQNEPPTEAWILNDLIGGTVTTLSSNPIDLINTTLSPLNGIVSNSWNGYYKALYQANNIISITNGLPQSANRNRVKGTAHYFRAYIYYCLVTHWGEVPVLRTNTNDLVPRNPVNEVWAFIEEDLDVAMDLLGTSSSYYYVCRDAAVALKARVMLSQQKNEQAGSLAESLITGGKYQLDTFEKIFRKIQNNEVIFAFENNTEESNNAISNLFYGYFMPNKGSYLYRPSQSVLGMFESGDLRKPMSLDNVAGNDVINKYPGGQGGRDPVIISRLAEMYLISAEAKGRVAGLARLNELRQKRGVSPVSPATNDAFIDAILLERKRELMAEGFMYYDYVRTGKAISVLGITEIQLLLPVPGSERRVNPNLTQNTGY